MISCHFSLLPICQVNQGIQPPSAKEVKLVLIATDTILALSAIILKNWFFVPMPMPLPDSS